jgi:hypothetical protein
LAPTVYGTTPIGNLESFLGTTDAKSLVFGTNNLERFRITDLGRLGIGTATPANQLEIRQGTAGNSGLRFTNLTSASTATTSSNKVLSVNAFGDVILTNVPGTQNIVDFSTATPTTSGVVFTPNTPTDETVIYQSSIDNNMWTYNGTAYVTYTPTSSSAWFTAGTTNDAGNSKTSNIYRTGRVGIGTNNPANNLDVVGGFNLRNTPGAAGSNFGIEFNTNSNAPRIDWVFNGGYIGQFSSDANNFILNNSKLSTGGFRFTTNPGSGALDRLNILNNGNIGIGTASPANKLEITHGTAGNSGLRFTNLTSSSSATTASSKVLGVNNNGDVILTNVPGTQNIVDFAVNANPNTAGTTFTPNNQADESVVYQSAVDNSMWTYNGTAYVTYTAPASTAWFTAGTTNDAGNSKTSNIYRTGNVGIGTTSPSFSLDVQGSNAGINIVRSGGTDAFFRLNSGANNTTITQIRSTPTGNLNFTTNDVATRMTITQAGNVGIGTSASLGRFVVNDNAYIAALPATVSNLMDNTTFRPLTRFQTTAGINNNAISHYMTTATAATQVHSYTTGAALPYVLQPAGGYVGIGTGNTLPSANLHVSGIAATNSINADAPVLRLSRPITNSVKNDNIAQFNLGSYSAANPNAFSRLDLALNDGSALPLTNVMTWQANGRVGINTITPVSNFDVISATSTDVARFTTSLTGTNYAGIGIGNASGGWGKIASGDNKFQIRNFSTDAVIINAELVTGNVGIGTNSPGSRLEVNGSATNTTAFNAVAGTTINFANSNLAYTTASPGAFVIQGMKDGGTYTLAVQGTTSATASFSSSGFTFLSANNGATIAGKQTLYTFIVMGTTVYVYMATGF